MCVSVDIFERKSTYSFIQNNLFVFVGFGDAALFVSIFEQVFKEICDFPILVIILLNKKICIIGNIWKN